MHSPFDAKDLTVIAYADDVNLLVKSKEELEKITTNFQNYEDVSNMKINLDKSNIVTLRKWMEKEYKEEYKDNAIKVTPLEKASAIKFLGISINGESNWEEIFGKIQKQLWYPLLADVPLNIRAELMNIYIMSQIYGRDPHNPLSEDQIKTLDNMIQKAHFKNKVSVEKLKMMTIHGGFEIMDLLNQLDGKRAKILFHTIVGDGPVEIHNKELLQWLALCFTTLFADEVDFMNDLNYKNWAQWDKGFERKEILYKSFPWTDFLNGNFERAFNNIFKKQDVFEKFFKGGELRDLHVETNYINIEDILFRILPAIKIPRKIERHFEKPKLAYSFTLDIVRLLTPSEIEGLKSWFKLFKGSNNDANQEVLKIESKNKTNMYKDYILNKDFGEEKTLKVLKDIEGKEINVESFKGVNKKLRRLHEEPFTRTPSYKVDFGDETEEEIKERYAEFWNFLAKVNKNKPGYLETLHLFNLGVVEHYYFNHKNGEQCSGCEKQGETLYHTFEKCEFTHYIWEELGFSDYHFPRPFSLTELTTPTDHTQDEKLMRKMSIWIEILAYARFAKKDGLTKEQVVNAAKYKLKVIHQKYGFKDYKRL
ncbi:unnamed protein product [Wickerhamomyces anomalus]